ncbi:hypothetical protein OH492_23990 [Vibrio chagasii]|nr:hypothetical protein [Vibrio chagasii]
MVTGPQQQEGAPAGGFGNAYQGAAHDSTMIYRPQACQVKEGLKKLQWPARRLKF